MAEDAKVRVRYAPSPTGHLHIGNARTAIFNYLFARHNNGEFIIRIEDTDSARNVEDGEKSQLENLKWLGVDWDEGPDKPNPKYGDYHQSKRQDLYQKYIDELLSKGLAFYSYMTEEELEAQRDKQKANHQMPHYEYEYEGMNSDQIKEAQAAAESKGLKPVIRFRVPENEKIEFDDIVKGEIEFNSNDVGGDFVIQKRDGMPTYNFAVVVDDHLMEITHVLRGDDHIANTPKQIMIYNALGWQAPQFGHMTLIINSETGKKLSKRDETILQFIEQYRKLGYLPEAMFNFIVLLGWSPVGEEEIFTKKQLIKQFDPSRLSKSPAKFDNSKLEWVNNQYIKKSNPDKITDLSLQQLVEAGQTKSNPGMETISWLDNVIALYLDHMSYAEQIVDFSRMFFDEPIIDETTKEELAQDLEGAKQVIDAFRKEVVEMPMFSAQQIQDAISRVQAQTGIKGRRLYMPVRIAATKTQHGPAIGKTLELFGREKVLNNIDDVLKTQF